MIATAALLVFGTGLLWVFVPAPDPAGILAGTASAAGVIALFLTPRPRLGFVIFLALVASAVVVVCVTEGTALQAPRIVEAVFSSRDGLLFWNPAVWLGLGGLALLWRSGRGRVTALAAALLLAVTALACLPAGPSGPAAARRFAPVLPLLGPGVAASLAALVRGARRAPGAVLGAAGALLVLWNLLFMEQYRTGRVPRDSTVSFVSVAERSAALLSRLAGSPVAWPANWLFASASGLPADRFDLLAGKRLPEQPDGARAIEVGDLSFDEALLLEGWSVRHPCGAGACRDVEGRARLVAPLEAPATYDLAIHASGEGVLVATINGVPVGGGGLSPEPSVVRFLVPDRWRRLNVVSLAVSHGGRARVDRIVLEPRGSAS